jgi:glycosyltransferase involved in cell wall biosynthesis
MYQLFLNDALDRVLANPLASHCWLNLASVTRSCQLAGMDSALIEAGMALLRANLADQGVVGFYFALYGDFVTHDVQYLARASELLPTIVPHDLDRMVAYFTFAWQSALARSAARSEFLHILQSSGLASLGRFMGKLVAQRQLARMPQRSITKVQKVAVLAPDLLSSRSTPAMMALEQAQLASQNGMQTGLFACQETLIPDFEKLLGNGCTTGTGSYQLEALIRERGLNLTVGVSDPRFSLMRRMSDMMAQLCAFDPDLILFVGFHSSLIEALYAQRPILVLSVNAIAPIVPADGWLAARADARADIWLPHVAACPILHHPWRVHRKLPLATLARADWGVDDNALVLISTAWAAPIKVAASWLQGMATFLQQHPAAIWVLPGSDERMQAVLQALPAQQLRLLPATENVMGVLACGDIYVNPPRMGGGFAVADAMAAGLPVLSFANSDGGDKLGSAACADEERFFATLANWAGNAGLRTQVGAQMRQMFDANIDLARAGPNLALAYDAALAHYQQRMSSNA